MRLNLTKRSLILSLILILGVIFIARADIFDDIALALKTGNAKEVARYFGPQIEIRILEKENVYSKTQAELVLKEFFAKNPPKDFNIVHRGSSEKGAQYAIGQLITENGNFRAYFFIKEVGDKPHIHELRFEKD